MHTITDSDFDHGQGGFWVTDTGDVHHVREYAGHMDTLYAMEEELGWEVGYTSAYNHGWVRISWRQHSQYPALNVDFDPRYTTVVALQQVAKIVRHARMANIGTYEAQRQDQWEDEEADYGVTTFEGAAGQAKLARLIMGHAMAKNAELKRVVEMA